MAHAGKRCRLLALCAMLRLCLNVAGGEEEDFRWRRRPVYLPPVLWYDPDYRDSGNFLMLMSLYWSGQWDTGSLKVVAPFYFNSSTPQRSVTGVTPLWWRTAAADGSEQSTFAGPLFMRSGRGERALSLFPLLWHSSTDDGKASTLVLPVFYRKADKSTPFTRGFAGLYHWDIWRDRRRHVLFPIYWFNARGENSMRVVPPFYSRKRGNDGAWGLFPLMQSYHKAGAKGTYVFPVMAFRREGDNKSRTYLFPYYGTRQGKWRTDVIIPIAWFENGGRSAAIVGPLYHTGSHFGVFPFIDIGSRSGWVLPYFWGRRSYSTGSNGKDRYKNYDVLFPFLWSFRATQKSSFALVPFYWSRSGGGDTRRAKWGFWPLVGYRREPDRSKGHVFPLASWDRHKPTGDGHGYLGPYFWRDGSASYRVVFPFFWRAKGRKRSTTIAFPYYSTWRGDTRKLGVFPFYQRKEVGKTASSYLLPVYYNRRNPDAGARKTWCGPYYHRRQPGDKVTTVVPVYWNRVKGDTEKGLFTLYYWSLRPGAASRVLFPVWWRTAKGKGDATIKSTVVPPFYNKTGRDVLKRGMFPLLWYHSVRDTKHMAALPAFWRKDVGKTGRGFFTLFYWSRKANSSRNVLFPILWMRRDGEKRTVVLPPFYRESSPAGSKAGLFPIAWRHSMGSRRSTGLLPIFCRRESNDSAFTMAGPVWWKHTGRHKAGGAFPFVWLTRRPEKSSTIVMPIWWTWRYPKQERSHGLVGPWYWNSSEASDTNVLFPLWWRFDDHKHRLTVVPPVYWTTGPAKNKIGLFPIAWRHSGEDGSSVGLLPVFWRDSFPSKGRTRGFVGPYYWNTGPDTKFRTVFPLYWRHEDDISSRLVIPPFYRMRARNAAKTALFPLLWRSRRGPESRTAVLPLFYRRSAPEAATILTPLSWYQRRGGSDRGLVGPYYWSADVPKRTRTKVLFPFFWRLEAGEDEKTNVLAPLYYSHRFKARTVRLVAPLYLDVKTDRSSLRLIPPYYTKTKKKNNWRRVSVIPLFNFERDDAGNSFKGFLGDAFCYDRQSHGGKTKRRLRLFWLIYIPL